MKTTSKKLRPILKEIFDYLHANPEVSWKEFQTTEYIKGLLANKKVNIQCFPEITGLVVEIGSGKPVVALRADMDALWQEVNGEFKANHSCGHDAHMTIVLGVLFTLLEEGTPDQGTFRFIFQPAEEKGDGALTLVEKGVVDDADFLYGLHLRPIQELKHGQFSPAIRHGASWSVDGVITGEDAHGARPHLNANAIQVGSEFFQHLNNIYIDPMIPHSVKMTSFHAGGESTNIIPGNATFSIDMRAQTNEAMEELLEKVERIANMLSNYHGVKIDLSISSSVAAAVINEEATNLMEEAIVETVGKDHLIPMITTTGGDDFHFYTIKRPSLKATMLAVGCDLEPGLHHPQMTFNYQAIEPSVEILVTVLRRTVRKYQG
ncbi:M20 peptidase aminoacylase family protein [Ornithinibacillus sp. BX22]|uniref:M20 peptidase aminoacylase family protein n=2 Tax=Ornithinibacillus TaxID=484508 RepID=A0A923L7D3_9BACI|nr:MULTISPECIES: M20 peptidase aminoacylase family protein [Ornithinibacillus]MBC5637772.1 M20 peptidase aminoacylase family protein [Ornithinibacillus hominis]MBS3681958.1 M20 peptidase aminoacylase family protein [Ornithinibacillus massiliensis]